MVHYKNIYLVAKEYPQILGIDFVEIFFSSY